MVSLLSNVRNTFLNLAFPQRCHSCSDHVDDDRLGVACFECWENTTFFASSEGLCPKCGAKSLTSDTAFACRGCVDHHYDTARSIGVYEHAMSSSILHLKRHPVLPKILLDRIPQILDSTGYGNYDLVLPVPLSTKRRAERGFNQAEFIASHVAKILHKTVDIRSLSRKVHTPMHRASMDRKAREQSVKNAFEVIRPKLIEKRSILLVDDILTSGATVSNCARSLKKAGAQRIEVFTLARA